MRFVVDDKIPYIRPYLQSWGECRFMPGAEISAQDCREADCLVVRTRTHVDEQLLQGSSVRLVVTATIGYDHIDTDYLQRAHIRWTNCPGCNATSVAQYVEAVVNETLRYENENENIVMGIVGCGHVGSAVRAMAERHGWEVRVSDPPLGLNDDLSDCNVITFHTPLTYPADGLHPGSTVSAHPTYHMASDAFFARLRRRPMIINAARGGVVDESALLRAMDAGLVGPVAIDTWEHEPQPNPELLRRALIATPHIAGYSANGKANATLMSLRAIAAEFGLPAPLVSDGTPLTPQALLEATYGPLHPEPYDPQRDSQALKSAPSRFEWLRGHYPLRLE